MDRIYIFYLDPASQCIACRLSKKSLDLAVDPSKIQQNLPETLLGNSERENEPS